MVSFVRKLERVVVEVGIEWGKFGVLSSKILYRFSLCVSLSLSPSIPPYLTISFVRKLERKKGGSV